MKRLLLVGLALLLTACSNNGIAPPKRSNVKVDTPNLVSKKAALGVEPCQPGTATKGGLPDVTLRCLGGGDEVNLSTLRGPLVVNVWQSTCGPCRQEMPALQEFHEKYGDQVPIIGIDIEDVFPGSAMDLIGETGATYPMLADVDGDLQETDLATAFLPTFFFLSADGKVTSSRGGLDSLDEVVKLVNDQLGLDL